MAGINKSFRNHIFSPSSPLQFAYPLASKSKARVQACQFPTYNQPHITPVHWVSCSSFSSYRRLVSETNAQTVGQLSSLHYKTLLHNYSVKPIAGGYLQKALDQGTRSWDVTFSLYTTFVLVTALALRHAGSKPKIWNALIESAALKWRNVKMRLPSNSTNIHDLRAELTLQPRVPMRLIQDALYLNIEDSVICPVKALLVLAIRLGITYGTTIESVIDDAVQNNKGIIRWRDHAMERHVVSRIQQNADHLPYLCNDPEYTQVRLSAESMRKRIVWVLDSLKEYDKVISGKDFRVEVLEDKFIDTKSFIKCFSRINISTIPDFIVSQQTQTGESEDALPQDSHFCPNRELGCVYKSNVLRDVQYHKQVCPYTKNSSNIKWRKMFNCLEAGCSSKFSSMDKLQFHLKRTHHQIWTPRPCPHKNCHTEVFSNFEEFYQHRIAFHYTWQPTRCYVTDCRHPHLYMHEHSLYRHLRFKHGLKTREQRLVYLFPDVYLKSGRYDG